MKINKKNLPTTDETRGVLNGHETGIAKLYPCEPSYIFNIKNGHEPDPHAFYRKWFQDCAFGGGKVRLYLHDLEAIAHQAENGINPTGNLIQKFLRKIETDAKSTHVLAQSIADNHLDATECDKILAACDQMKAEEQSLREMALNRKNELRIKK